MFIREASKTDAPVISRLQRQMLEEDGIYGFAAESAGEIEKSINAYFLIAESDGEIIGFISGDVFKSESLAVIPKGEKCLEIENLFVVPGRRNRGVGGRLIDEILTRARKDGVAYASLYSAAKDVRSILKFYERHGFRSWYVRMFQKL